MVAIIHSSFISVAGAILVGRFKEGSAPANINYSVGLELRSIFDDNIARPVKMPQILERDHFGSAVTEFAVYSQILAKVLIKELDETLEMVDSFFIRNFSLRTNRIGHNGRFGKG